MNRADAIEENSKVRISTLILVLYLIFLPISTAMSGFLISSSIQSVVAVVFIAVSVLEVLISRKLTFDKRLTPVYLFFAFMLLTSLWNKYFELDWYLLQFAVTFLIIVCVSIRYYSDAELKFIEIAFYCSILSAIISSLFFSYMNGGRMYIRIFSRMDPNDFACGLAIAFALCLSTLKKSKRAILNGICLVAILVIVYFTGSRGGLLTMLAIIFVWVLSIKGRLKYQLLVLMFAAVALLLFCAEYGIGPSLIRRFSITSLIASGGTGRLDIWKAAFNCFKSQDPFHILFGNGYGSFFQTVRYVAIGNNYQYASHNMYVNTLIEGGIFGLGLMMSCFITLYVYAIKHKNLFGVLAITGFIVSGVSLDTQAYRTFAIAVAVAIIWRKSDYAILNRDKDPSSKELLGNEITQRR